MSEDGIGFDTSAFGGDGTPKPLTVARIAVAGAAEELARLAEHLRAVEGEAERTPALVAEAERRAADAERRAAEAERWAAEARAQLDEAVTRATLAESRAEYAERLVAESQEAIRAAEARAAEAELRGGPRLEERLRAAEERAADAEERLEIETARTVELTRRLDEAARAERTADRRADAAEERAHLAIERTKQLEAEVASLEAALNEARKAPPVTVIVDEARTALQEAVAAELRRPLSSIMGLTLALKHQDGAGALDMVRQLSMHARKLDRLVAEYLELDRLIDGTLKPNRRRTNLEALVRRVIEESPDLANIDVRVETSRATIAVDPMLVEQIVEALLANAGRRTAPGNSVRVKVWQDDKGATIAVEDAGEPVPAPLREALLDPGQVLRSTSPKGGTGLILMSRLAQIHRGRATVEDLPGGGASFRVFLPAVEEAGEAEASAAPIGGAQSTLEDGAIAI